MLPQELRKKGNTELPIIFLKKKRVKENGFPFSL